MTAGGRSRGDGPEPEVTICLGAGGVGKTTVAAALAVASALAGRRTVVLTIDPARRLADLLGGGEAVGDEPRPVEGPWDGELWAAMLDPVRTFEDAVRRHRGTGIDSRLIRAIAGSLSGTNEYMAAERLHQLVHDPRFDRIVIDTPPSRHAIDFLDSPARLAGLVDNRLFRAVLAPSRHRFDPAVGAARLATRLVGRLVGSDLLNQVVDLFADLDGVAEGFRARADETARLLAGPRCRYVLVTSARREPVNHARWILDHLGARDLAVSALVANRLTAHGHLDRPEPTGGRAAERDALARNLAQLGALGASERALIEELTRAAGRPPVRELTERATPVVTVEELVELAGEVAPERQVTRPATPRPAPPPPPRSTR